MENCTIYSHQLDFDQVANIIKSGLPKANVEVNDGGKQKGLVATIKGGLFGKTKTLTINYRERENPSYKLEKIECGLTQNLAGMVNFIQAIPAQNEEVKNKFLHKVMAANCEMAFIGEPSITSEMEQVLSKITAHLDAYLFVQPNRIFSKSTAQHFVDKEMNLILDTNGNSEVTDVSVTVDAKYHDGPTGNYSDEQLERKSRSEAVLNQRDIKINKNLPCIDTSEGVLRSKEEVLDRVYALMIIAALGEGVPVEKLQRPIADKGIKSFTEREEAILNLEELSDQQRAYATWRYESLYTLLWALNLFPELKFPSEICDVTAVVSKLIQPSREEVTSMANLRPATEILDELDKTYRMHWACVDARIKGEQVGGNINPSVIYERHYALNWLTRYLGQEWDHVQTNT